MYVRLGLANPKEGMTQDALNYFRDVAIPVYDQVSGLLSAAACINSEGQLMARTMWANNEAKDAAVAEVQENLSGSTDFITEPPTILEGQKVAAQQYIMVPKEGGDSFFARFVMGAGMQDGKTYDDAANFMKSTVYPAYENVEGIYASAACKVDDDTGFSFNFWTNHDAAHAASDVIADVVKDAVSNLIKEAPKELTGECNVWKNYVDFPVGKL